MVNLHINVHPIFMLHNLVQLESIATEYNFEFACQGWRIVTVNRRE